MDFLAEPWDISAETDSLNQKLFGSHISPLGKVKEKKRKTKARGKTNKIAENRKECESSDTACIPKSERKGKKRALDSVSSDEKSKKKKIFKAEEGTNNSDSNMMKKMKKSKKNKFKLENSSNVSRQPGGKNFQRRETKKASKRSAEKEVFSENRTGEAGIPNIVEKSKLPKRLKKTAVVMGKDHQFSESVMRDIDREPTENTGKSSGKVSGEKRTKSKTKNKNSAKKSDSDNDSTYKSTSEKSKNIVKKKTFNPAILAGMLASVPESKIATKKKNETHNKRTENEIEHRKQKPKKQKKTVMEEEATNDLEKDPLKPLSLKERLMEQLNSARFRYINEQLYTQTGEEAQEMFEEDEEAFQVYHQGFQTQVNKWPVNPVDILIKDITHLPHNKVIADFGCGDAKIARNVPQKVYSFDLVALNDHVTACDMAHVPLGDGSVDVAVFCLSLMGTNLADYLTEAHRVLKSGGQLKIAEVASRFQSLPQFLLKIEQFGFNQLSKDTSNKMFHLFNFKKKGKPKGRAPVLTLEPCVYKKR